MAELNVALLAVGHRLARAIQAAADLDVASALLDGPRNSVELATRLGVDPRGLRLLLRALVSEGIFEQVDDDSYGLNDAARQLLPAASGGIREIILGWLGHPAIYRGIERLADGIRSGRPAFELTHEATFFEWLEQHPTELASYQEAVGGETTEEFTSTVEVLDLADARVVADIGGGGGGLLRAILDRWPHLTGMLIELPAVLERARPLIESDEHRDRITCVVADCTEHVPPGADVYVMSTLLRYFDDEQAARVLRNVRDALTEAAPPRRLILSEMPIEDGPPTSPAALKSLLEYALSGGEDRSRAGLRQLIEDAGFAAVALTHREGPFWIVEAQLP